ncbi:hypothetical protein [Nonomuraea jabiensis]|uniref:hypothetical protein n=1 Tax=Nonomuraea jabiensis TaxID=882448 RepID=UPI003D709A69
MRRELNTPAGLDTLYDAATGAAVSSADQPDAELVPGGVAFSGPDVFALPRNSAGRRPAPSASPWS